MLHRPQSLDAALALLSGEGAVILAGGTDVYPGLRDGPPPATMVDLSALPGFRGITRAHGVWRIGAATTWSDAIRADVPPLFDGLKLAAREVGSVQIQNAGTVAGNICNASPAADGVPPLLALDAEVELLGPEGVRRLALSDFIRGPRDTALKPGELITAIVIADTPGQGAFLKLGARKYLVISIAMVGAVIAVEDGYISRARIAVGACSAVACRLPELETALRGAGPRDIAEIVATAAMPSLAPISDVRATAAYRSEAVRTLVTRTVLQAMEACDVA
ncbi:FAD binding domain-containing protein [Primorskyibacter flagellatus]|uniref:CO or xanthine dehydrogenase, FAD-binding subunit n=1 Tax=Primorskyibacter flagellatus TaxID=1387277 RepID=A0A1W1ZAY6_9RHOB|nr:xanthine dehydrogenase family protein subunit M [Primorskyibacter flagellatus]SMC45569.1 CO or xanthine dehydrogenase, FAD-binding subunit [Primorskyibacter flagellatus]